jgi:cation transport protein ChaC
MARLNGAHRALCVYSWVHRGTPERPGLVLGLDRGGACRGVAFRVAPQEWEGVLAYLREREQVTDVYLERMREVRFDDGSAAPALAYLVDRGHGQYAGKLDEDTQFRIISDASGRSGRNHDYVINTAEHLAELGMPDLSLDRLALRLKALLPA